MHAITVVFGPTNTMMTFLFRDAEKARAAYNDASMIVGAMTGSARIIDEFGQETEFAANSLHAVMIEDWEKSKNAHIERAMHNAHTQADANRAAQADPKLRTAAMMNGPVAHPGPMPRA